MIAIENNSVAPTINAAFGSKLGLDNQHIDSGAGLFVYALAGNTIGRKPENGGNHTGFDETGSSYTLTKTDVHAVVYPINTQIATRHEAMGEGTGMGIGADGAAAYMLQAAHSHSVAYISGSDSENNGHLMDDATGPLMKGSPAGGGRPLPAICYRTNAAGQVMNQGDVSATINTFTDPTTQFLHHQMQVRRLTPMECERLQGFPDNYTNIPGSSDTTRYKALGNSMATNVMNLIATRIDNAVSNA